LQFFKKRFAELHKLSPQEREQRISQLSKSPKLARKAKEALFGKHTPSERLRLYVTIAELFAEMQDVRKSFVLRANHYHQQFLETVSKQYSQPIESLWFYTYHEMLNAIESGQFIPAQEVARRKKMVVEVASKKEQVVLSGDEAQFFFEQLQEKTAEAKEFRGTIAQAGKVQGTVKVVLKSIDIAKVQAGDILVASMTRPEMTPAMHKAAGFITDEGGITSHAAIVARELKKPCIIGTKIATKILKDGDRVEIDAKQGIVRKLS
jgi:phosphoenolpyruvate synthase/pyruvate phosphate dikinase